VVYLSTLQILRACDSEREPPKTVKSWLNTYTGRPGNARSEATRKAARKKTVDSALSSHNSVARDLYNEDFWVLCVREKKGF